MPSDLHEILLDLVEHAPQVLSRLLPEHADLLPASLRATAQKTQAKQQTHVNADLVLEVCRDGRARPGLGLVVEAQLRVDERKALTWPHYVTSLHLQLALPAYLVVITLDPKVAAWAKGPFEVGSMTLRPWVIGPQDIPAITDEGGAQEAPELAMMSALAHRDRLASAQIVTAIRKALDALDHPYRDRYWDVLLNSVDHSFRRTLQMRLDNYVPRSDWGRAHYAKGKTEGKAELLVKQMTLKFGSPTPTVVERIEAATIEQLDRWALRILTAGTVDQMLAD